MNPEQEKIKRRFERFEKEEREIPVYIVASDNYKTISRYARQNGMSTGAVNKIRNRIRESYEWRRIMKTVRGFNEQTEKNE
jgi:ribosomal protein L39E